MKAIFFDLDGTLVDSRADLATGVNLTRADFGLPSLPVETIVGFVGNGVKRLIERSVPEEASRIDELLERFSENYRAHMVDETVLYPRVAETLAELSTRGFLLGVTTNKPNYAARGILGKLGILEFFGDSIVAGGDCKELKPSASPLVECASRMGGHVIGPGDWIVGDNWTDVECGINAHVKTAFCNFGFGNLDGRKCDVRLDEFADILKFASAK